MNAEPSASTTLHALPTWRRAVLKVGSSLLAADGGGLSPRYALGLAQFVSASLAAGREVVIVSSGAVAAGRAIVPAAAAAGTAMAARQALAALGQAQLIGLWQRFFERPVAQVLLTHDDLRNRRRYLNARATLVELLALGALPVVNENDTVSVDELKLGDNDNLAAIVAALIDADVLFIASDVDGLYDADPRTHPDARLLAEVPELTPAVLAMAGGSGSMAGTGGMRTDEAALQLLALLRGDLHFRECAEPCRDSVVGAIVGREFVDHAAGGSGRTPGRAGGTGVVGVAQSTQGIDHGNRAGRPCLGQGRRAQA